MDTKLIGSLIVILIGFLSFVGIGSILMSIIFDPDESKSSSYNSQPEIDYSNTTEGSNEPASVILQSSIDFNFESLKES